MEAAFQRWRKLATAGFLKLGKIQSSCKTLRWVAGPGALLEEHGSARCQPLRARELESFNYFTYIFTIPTAVDCFNDEQYLSHYGRLLC